MQAWSTRRELLIAVLVLVISCAVLPGLIYLVGSRLFGSYGGTRGIAGMYVATFTDLLVPRLAAWLLVTTPVLCVVLLRALFYLTRQVTTAPVVAAEVRREPTLGS